VNIVSNKSWNQSRKKNIMPKEKPHQKHKTENKFATELIKELNFQTASKKQLFSDQLGKRRRVP